MMHILLLPLLLLIKPTDIGARSVPSRPRVVNTCCLPRVWTADYHWDVSNSSGRVVVDYTQELFASRGNPGVSAANWRLQSRGGRYLQHSVTKRMKRDLTYARPITAAIELNRCLQNGRLVTQGTSQFLVFDLKDEHRVAARSKCNNLVHRGTQVQMWVNPDNCMPQKLRFYTYARGSHLTYHLPPPIFDLRNVHGHNNGLEADALLFYETSPALAAAAQERCPTGGTNPYVNAIRNSRLRLQQRLLQLRQRLNNRR